MNKIQFLFASLFLYNFTINHLPVEAQITPDNTLGNDSSKIDSNVSIKGFNADQVNGGVTRGSNLFHSFSEFNIKDGQRVYFSNPSGVLNILTRVTGKNSSSIFGTLGVDGNANLFLMNPNGILFGKNASLDVQGSFVGTTANGLQFGNQGVFSVTNPEAPGLLTINPNALVFSQQQSGTITNQSQAKAGLNLSGGDATGLRVPDSETLLLVGGNVSMDGGQLNAFGGRVELGGLAESGNVDLLFNGDNLSLKFPENIIRADVSLTNKAGVYVTGAGSGNLAINARNLEVLQGSILSAGIGAGLGTPDTVAGDITLNATGEIKVADSGSNIRNLVRGDSKGNGGNIFINSGSFSLRDGAQLLASTYGQGNAGNVKVTATETISLKYPESYIFSTVEAEGVGKGGNIDINAASLSLSGGAQIGTFTRGQGDAGFIKINVSDLVSLDGSNGIFGTGVFNSVEDSGIGKGGDINIQTKMLTVTNAAAIVASARGKGDAGNIQINASDSINISGNNLDTGYSSGIFAFTLPKSTGQGGNIEINTSNLHLSEGGILDVRTRNERQGGSIIIKADTVQLFNGGGILSTTSGSGSAGKINVNAREKLIIDGFDRTFNNRIIKVGEEPLFNYFISTDSASSILVRSKSSGITGDIEVNSPKITLDNGGTLNAESASGNGGNINLTSDLLLLRRNSQISTTAGTAQSGGDSGSINLNTKFIVAVPNENSDITANAFSGKGGNVNIQTQGIFGIEPRSKPTDQSDITASSELGIQGQVSIQKPDVDPNRGLVQSPQVFKDKSDEIDQLCGRGKKPLAEFIITGKQGTLATNPVTNLMQGGVDFTPLASLDESNSNNRVNQIPDRLMVQNPPQNRIVEAQAIVKGADGTLYLVAEAPNAIPNSRPAVPACANVRR
jgi:filamentous hemagglutinin family protein